MPSPTTDQSRSNEKFDSIIADYVDTTTIHGVKDVYNSTRISSRTMWTFFLASCFGFCFYEMTQIQKDYAKDGTVIQLSPLSPGTYPYPHVRYCPKSWMNISKILELDVNHTVLIYSLSLLHQLIIPECKRSISFNRTIGDLDVQLQDYLDENGLKDYFAFYLAIAKDSNAIVKCDGCNSNTSSPKPVVTSIGVCYDLYFEDRPWQTKYMYDLQCVGFTTHPFDNASEHSYLDYYDTIFATDVVYIGEHSSDFFGWDPIFLNAHKEHTIKLKPTHKMQLPKNDSPCLMDPSPEYSDKMCSAECAENYFSTKCWGGVIHLGHVKKKKSNLNWWSSLYNNYTLDMTPCERKYLPDVRQCSSKKCHSSCEIWDFDKSLQLAPYCMEHDPSVSKALKMGGHRVDFSYLAFEGTVLEEIPMMSTNTFISNMGCQIGLWFGGSAVSLLQVCQLVAKLFRYMTNREVREPNTAG